MFRAMALPSGGSRSRHGYDNLCMAMGEKVALVRLCMIDGTKTGKKSVSFSGHISDGLSVVSVRAEPHKGYVTERVRSSAA